MKKPFLSLIFFACVLSFTLVRSQTPSGNSSQIPPAGQPQSGQTNDDDVVRITTNLIQFDVTVTDKSGKPVPDLRPEDFEILENDHSRKITNFSYIPLAPAGDSAPVIPDRNAVPTPPIRLRPDQVRRTIALVVDDLSLSFESSYSVRQALKKFLDTQMQPGDLVAIIRTAGGMGAAQQFTSDKRQLYATIDKVRWNPNGSATETESPSGDSDPNSAKTDGGAPKSPNGIDDNGFREELFAVGTLGALNYIVRGLRELPGRKSVVLFSDGFRLLDSVGVNYDRTTDSLRRLTDLANRASVVVYTVDSRGLVDNGLSAADYTRGKNADQIAQIFSGRARRLFDTQSGLSYLAEQTGGIAIRGNNDLSDGVKRILDDQQGYYLIDYQPEEESFDPRHLRFNSFKVKIKRPGLKVRYRNGYYGITDDKAHENSDGTPVHMLASAVMSPFNSGDVQLQLTTLGGNDANVGSYVRSFLHIRVQDLTFVDEPTGTHRASFDLMAVTFGDNGVAVDQSYRTYTVHLPDATYKHALKAGFVYVETVPVKKAGAYQLRIAIRDTVSNRIGSASQFVDLPDLKKNRLFLSGVAAFGLEASSVKTSAGGPTTSDAAPPEEDPEVGVATRHFQRGMFLQYGCIIYNAKTDRSTGRPQLTSQIRLFRDGKEVFAGNPVAYDATGQTDLLRLPFGGAVRLGSNLTPGEYVLQVEITDVLAPEKQRLATQWIDFEIVP